MSTTFVQNSTDNPVCIPGFQAFEPNETREVSKEDAQILLANPFLVESSKSSDSSETLDDEKKSTTKKAK